MMPAIPIARAPAAFRVPVGSTAPTLVEDEGVGVEAAKAAFCVSESESVFDLVEVVLDANMANLLVFVKAVSF